jgi:hypothetical protein
VRSSASTCNTSTAASNSNSTKNYLAHGINPACCASSRPSEEGLHQAHAQGSSMPTSSIAQAIAAQPLVAFLGADGERHVAHAQARMAMRLAYRSGPPIQPLRNMNSRWRRFPARAVGAQQGTAVRFHQIIKRSTIARMVDSPPITS